MNPVQRPSLAALVVACFISAACDPHDSTVPPPTPQSIRASTPSIPGGLGGAAPGITASMSGMGASR